MRIALNLASRRFVELGPLYTQLRVAMIVLALAAIPLWFFMSAEHHKAQEAQGRLAAVNGEIHSLQREQQGFRSEMAQPQNASVLTEAQFLNGIFARKAFSWTAVMMDLENVLPTGVQVLNIDPVIAKDGSVTIRLRVSGERDRAVALVRNLEHSRRFLSPRLAGESAETQNAPAPGRGFQPVSNPSGVNFDILAEYNPLPPKSAVGETAPATRPRHTPAGARHRLPAAAAGGAQ